MNFGPNASLFKYFAFFIFPFCSPGSENISLWRISDLKGPSQKLNAFYSLHVRSWVRKYKSKANFGAGSTFGDVAISPFFIFVLRSEDRNLSDFRGF